ncbi:hypothetical protein BDW68DRAFT_181705 [Aspergillus falconensis]
MELLKRTKPARATRTEKGKKRDAGVMAYATTIDGTIFCVRTKNLSNETTAPTGDLSDRSVSVPLYVIQARVKYGGNGGEFRWGDIELEAAFTSYTEARRFANTALLSPKDGVTKDSFGGYSEAEPDKTNCEYAVSVIVHAASDYGTEDLVIVVKSQDLKAVGVAEAAMRII